MLVDRRGSVCTLTINRPERRNALSGPVLAQLRAGLAELRADPSVRAVVVTGAGDRAFSAGADLVSASSPAAGPKAVGSTAGDLPAAGAAAGEGRDASAAGAAPAPTAGELHEARGELARLFEDLWDLGKPSIAKVRGYCLAGGLGVALACDIVVAADDATFGTPEIDIGIWPYMVTVALLQALTPKRALDLMMTGRRIGAAEAERIGLVSRVVATGDLDSVVEELATGLAQKPPAAMRAGRESFYTTLGLSPREALRYLHPLLSVATQSDEAVEGRAAFAERRQPSWAEPGSARL